MKNRHITLFLFILMFMAVACIASQVWGQPINRTKNDFMKMNSPSLTKNRVIIGADINYPPYSFLDKQGRPQGHDIEIMNKLAAMLKIQVEYKLRPWSEALQLKKMLVCFGVSALRARLAFSLSVFPQAPLSSNVIQNNMTYRLNYIKQLELLEM